MNHQNDLPLPSVSLLQSHSQNREDAYSLTALFSESKLSATTQENNFGLAVGNTLSYQLSFSNLDFVSDAVSQSAIAYYNLGNTYGNREQWHLAIAKYQKAILLNPRYFPAYHALARGLAKIGKPEDGSYYLEKAKKLSKNFLDGTEYLQLGYYFFRQYQYPKAIICYRQALKSKPRCAEAYFYLGHSYYARGNENLAIQCYQHAVDYDPENAKYKLQLAQSLQQKRNLTTAIHYYQSTIASDPNCWQAYYGLGNSFAEQKNWEKALQAYRQGIAIEPDYVWFYNNAGNACLKLQHWQLAKDYYLKAIQFNVSGFGHLGEICAKLGDWDRMQMS